MQAWLEVLYKAIISLGILIIAAFAIFMIWNVLFYPYYKKNRLDRELNANKDELQRIYLELNTAKSEHQEALEAYNVTINGNIELLTKKRDLILEIAVLEKKLEAIPEEVEETVSNDADSKANTEETTEEESAPKAEKKPEEKEVKKSTKTTKNNTKKTAKKPKN